MPQALAMLRGIERKFGRIRTFKFGRVRAVLFSHFDLYLFSCVTRNTGK